MLAASPVRDESKRFRVPRASHVSKIAIPKSLSPMVASLFFASAAVAAYAAWVGWHAESVASGLAASFAALLAGAALIQYPITHERLYSTACGIGSLVALVVSVWTSPLFNQTLQDGLAHASADFASPFTVQMYANQFASNDYQRFQRTQKRATRDCNLAGLGEAMRFGMSAAEAIYVDPLLSPFLSSSDEVPHWGVQCARDYLEAHAIASWAFPEVRGAERQALEQFANRTGKNWSPSEASQTE